MTAPPAPAGTVAYRAGGSIYLNLTNRCSCACEFADSPRRSARLARGTGKRIDVAVASPALARVVRRCQALPGQLLFQYRAADAPAQGTASTGVNLTMDSYKIEWTWNPDKGIYERKQNGRPDKDRDGTLLTTTNVVVLEMVYNPGISGSPDAKVSQEIACTIGPQVLNSL